MPPTDLLLAFLISTALFAFIPGPAMLYAAARTLAASGGRIPEEPRALRALPGVGAYTAGAVASIAFGRPEPALDGNAIRVLARVTDLDLPADRGWEGQAVAQALAA